MKKILSVVVLLITLVSFTFASPALAGDASKGAALFTAKCASCHMGGRNVVNPTKTLQKADLEKYGMYDLDKIKIQILNGKAAMPSFGKNLTGEEIEDVATYILSQAEKGW